MCDLGVRDDLGGRQKLVDAVGEGLARVHDALVAGLRHDLSRHVIQVGVELKDKWICLIYLLDHRKSTLARGSRWDYTPLAF